MKSITSKFTIFISIALLIILPLLLLPSGVEAGPQMAQYCYLPPFVMDTNATPNVFIVYEKGDDILKRAYPAAYNEDPNNPYVGFFESFDSSGNLYMYEYDSGNDYFYKSNCTPGGDGHKHMHSPANTCMAGNLLNWALMSSLDISRWALAGFGEPDPGAGKCAGKVFKYPAAGNLVSYGQWKDGNSITFEVITDGIKYTFKLTKSTGSNPTGLRIEKGDASGPGGTKGSGKCKKTTVILNGEVAVNYTDEPDEHRIGVLQEYMDKDRDYTYDTDALRFSIRRWNNGNAKQSDITKNSPTAAERKTLFENILCALSQAPPADGAAPLGTMAEDIVEYMRGNGASYIDNDSVTQTPYDWPNDPAKDCRSTVNVYMTTGADLGGNTLGALSPACDSLTYPDIFVNNACYAFNTDLYTTDGNPPQQNIITTVFHMNFYGTGVNASELRYASETISGGEYYDISQASDFKESFRQLLENILASASSASTVATLTTQSRESSTLTQAYFYPKLKEGSLLRWIGYLRLLWSDTSANLREDTQNKGTLDLIKDKILSFTLDKTASPPVYKARTYNDADGDMVIDSCSTYTDKDNNQVENIWEAQNILISRTPSETDADKRVIAIGIDDNNDGIVVNSASELREFTTALKTTLQPFWNFSSSCDNDASRWCAVDADCNACVADSSKGCSVDADCYTCSGNPSISCADDTCNTGGTKVCEDDLSITCTVDADCTTGSCRNVCTNNTNRVCSADSDCIGCTIDDGTCDTTLVVYASKVCENDLTVTCTDDTDCSAVGGSCKYLCTGNSNRVCTADSECIDDYSPCTTTDTCNNTGGACNDECDTNCAESVIKYLRGYDKPDPSGGSFRIRHECTADTDCPSGTCNTTSGVCSDTSSDITKTNKLGDIVYSTPRMSPNAQVNGYDTRYSDTTYTDFIENTIESNLPIVIVGANDGMVHAFKVARISDIDPPDTSGGGKETAEFLNMDNSTPTDLGKELWSYIPYNSMPYLKWYCETGYCHIPMVDARFTVIDASIAGLPSDTRTQSSWKRLLIGAMGLGGKELTVNSTTFSSSIFVIDITDPANPSLMWERSLPDKTLTSGKPGIVRLGADDVEGSWYVAIGSGPKSISTNTLDYKATNASMFVFNLRNGSESSGGGIDLGVSGIAVGDLLATDLDGDYQADDLYFGTYNTTTGNFYRLRIRDGATYTTDPASWVSSTVISVNRPIIAAPTVSTDTDRNIWLYFGTGMFLTLEHTSETTEYVYGVKETEDCWDGTVTGAACIYNDFLVTRDTASSIDIKFENATAAEVTCYCAGSPIQTYDCSAANSYCSGVTCGSDEDLIVTRVAGAELAGYAACNGEVDEDAIQCLTDVIVGKDGWKREAMTYDQETGSEVSSKIFAKPFVGGGIVNLTAYHPLTNACSLGGDTFLMTLHYTTGTSYFQPTILMSGGTSGSVSSLTLQASAKIGSGVPPMGESIIALPLPGDAYKVITQVSGSLPGTAVQASMAAEEGFILWLTK